jgi:D-beta-D-heptose 7-phosphate kinase/D-beta-D-heptose 1-phosphate adenosyltransferase
MIVEWDDLPALTGAVTMISGGFDPLHGGHVAYVSAAAALGQPVLCAVDPDAYVATKHPVLLPQDERVRVIDALADVEYVHPAATPIGAVLEQLRPRYFVKGSDWKEKLPEQEICDANEIEVVFVDTVTNSSSDLVKNLIER